MYKQKSTVFVPAPNMKSLEDMIEHIDFFYAGDVIKSINKVYTKQLNHSSFPASMFRDIFVDIYNWSFNKMMEKSKDIIISQNDFSDISNLIKSQPDSKLAFYSQNHISELKKSKLISPSTINSGYLPSYFKRSFFEGDVSAYYSPLIEDDMSDYHIYLVDKPIQSMVWSLQNISHYIDKDFTHHIEMPIYECDYNSLRIRVVDTQKLRNDKINSILNDN